MTDEAAVPYDEPTTMVEPLTPRRGRDLIPELKAQLKLTSVVVTRPAFFFDLDDTLVDSVYHLCWPGERRWNDVASNSPLAHFTGAFP
jgi:ABC-type transporter Mla maintaining outer membrane lipid asymmetry ATPase subunit MlaF